MKRQARNKLHLVPIAAAAVVCLLCALPFADSDLRAGHDAIFHILRIEGLAAALRGGAGWPVRIYSLICGGYGYAAGLFYPDLFLLPGALARALVLGPEPAFKLVMLYTVAAGCLTAYLAGRGIGKSRFAGTALMLLYGLCHYRLGNLFIRSAVGECMAMVFVPLVFWGLYDLTEQGFSRPWVLCVAFTGLVLTHTISLALCGLAALIWVLLRLPRVLNSQIIAKEVSAVAGCLALSAWYWAPLLEQFASDTFKVSEEPLTHLQYNVLGGGEYLALADFKAPGLWFYLALAAAAVLWLWCRRAGRPVGAAGAFCLAGALLALVPLRGLLPWAVLDETPLAAIQFPWRFHLLSQFLLALGLSLLLDQAVQGMTARLAALGACALAGVLGLALLWGQLPERVNYPADWFTAQRGETFYLVGAEWLPAGVNAQELAFEPAAQYTDSNGPHTGEYLPDGSFRFAYDGRTPGAHGIPKLWYKGYTARLTAVDGTVHTLPLRKDGAGRVELTVPQNAPAGTVTVAYTGTAVQRISGWCSVLALVAAIWACIWAIRRKRWDKPTALRK